VYLKMREDREVYAQRTTDIVATETGLEENVNTYLIMSPTIYGLGTGFFNKKSIQLPTIIRTAIKKDHVDVVGDGTGAWDAVHIQDLAPLYELLLVKVLQGEDVPSGKQGIFFSETGDFTWMQLAQGLANELHRQGILKTADVKPLTLQEAVEQWGNGSPQRAELGFASK
jgi:nucleoside-diphosphate-sugar epimerase